MKKVYLIISLLFTTFMVWAGSSDRDTPTYSVTFKESGGANIITMKPPTLGADYSLTLPTAVPGTANSPLVLSTSGVASYGIPLPTSAGSSGQLLQTNGTSVVLTTATYPGTAGTAGSVLRSNGTNILNTSTTWPTTSTVNRILYSSATNTIDEITTGNSGVLVTSGGGVPSISSTIPSATQDNITRLGTVASGVWSATAIAVTNGGTGLTSTTTSQLLYSSSTNTIAGLATGNNGTLITSAGGVPSISSTLPTAVQDNITRLGTVASGVWSATAVGVTKGGTGLTTVAANRLLYASATDTISGLASAANGTLVTDGSSVPSISSTLPSAVQGNITTLGTVSTALTLSAGTNSTSTSSGTLILSASGGIGFGGSMYGGGTTNQLGAPQTSATGYTAFSGNIAANSTGITDTQRALGLVSNAYYSTNAPTRLANLSGAGIILQARDSSTSAVIRFESNTIADGTAASPTLRGFMDAFGKWTLGSSGGTQQHAINGDMLFTGGIGLGGGTSLLSYHDKSTFTTAVTGYAAVNVTCYYERTGSTVTITCPNITGTSNSTTLRIPLPAALQSSIAIDQEKITRHCVDNGSNNATPGCMAFIPASGTYIDCRFSYPSGTTWTASGTKSFDAFVIQYLIN